MTGAGAIALLFAVKMLTKGVAVWPTAALFKMGGRDRTYTTLLMATGLTFGSISALYGLTNGLVTQQQYSVLVTVVVLSAIVPTAIAQRWFSPAVEDQQLEETVGEGDVAITHHHTAPASVVESQEQTRSGTD